jgi:ABC-2 type transport system permease protein
MKANRTFLIFRQELLVALKRKGFLVLTLSLPLLGLLAIGAYHLISGIETAPDSGPVTVGYVDQVGQFNAYTEQDGVSLVPYKDADTATQALVAREIKEYFIITPDYVATGVVPVFTMERRLTEPPEIAAAMTDFLQQNLMEGKVAPDVAARVQAPLFPAGVTLTETGAVAPEQGGYGNFIVPVVFALLLVLSLIFSSNYLLQGLGDEKENRLIEILLSSVSPRQLLTGKVLGLGAAGLVQVAFWLICIPLLLQLASSTIGDLLGMIQLPANFIALGLVYFILGYFLFAVLSAGVGAITPSARESQGLASIFTMLAVCPLWVLGVIMQFPDHWLWVVMTIFPLTAPVVVMVRLGMTGIPLWQLITSMVVMAACIVGGLWIAARVFRTYLLMHGKRPRLGEVLRSLRSG